MKSLWHYSPLLAVFLTPIFTVQADDLQATQYGDFSDYVLALSWHAGFCQSQHERHYQEPDECRMQKEPDNKADFLTVHGLWPGLPKSIAARGVDERRWRRFGCAARPVPNLPEVRTSRKCAAPSVGLSPDIATTLSEVMPGAGGTFCLERHEYAKHGACFGFDPNAYFGTMIRLDKAIKESALGHFLAENYGKTVSRAAFDRVVEQTWGKNNVKAVKVNCHGNPAYLTEIHFSLKASMINAPLSADSFLPQPHPGNCGKQFIIDKAGY